MAWTGSQTLARPSPTTTATSDPRQAVAGGRPVEGFTEFLRDARITHVLSLCTELEGGRHFTPERWNIQKHRHSPIYDSVVSSRADLEWFAREVQWVLDRTERGGTVYVHCVAGSSRTGMVVTALFMRIWHFTALQALAAVTRRRPATEPNACFRSLLDQYEVLCRENGWID